MSYAVELDCPQCAAPVTLDDTDHLVRCEYCGVSSFVTAKGCPRFVLPCRKPGENTVYAPYLHFRGAIYQCNGMALQHRLADISQAGVTLPFLPISLGLRPQTMKMKFVTPELPGRFLKNSLQVPALLKRAGSLSAAGNRDQLLFHIGETVQLIYLPLVIENDTVLDGVTSEPLATIDFGPGYWAPFPVEDTGWQPHCIATLCPQCGWDLEGERDSVVLCCRNCQSLWEGGGPGFSRVPLAARPSGGEGDTVFLPFWRLAATASNGLDIESFADFVRLTNQPLVVRPAWENRPMVYTIPAFKIRPQNFLQLATGLTVGHRDLETVEQIPGGLFHPITLPRSEAIQALKLVLANASINKIAVLPFLAATALEVRAFSLLYLPFTQGSHELVQQESGLAINRQNLLFGRQL